MWIYNLLAFLVVEQICSVEICFWLNVFKLLFIFYFWFLNLFKCFKCLNATKNLQYRKNMSCSHSYYSIFLLQSYGLNRLEDYYIWQILWRDHSSQNIKISFDHRVCSGWVVVTMGTVRSQVFNWFCFVVMRFLLNEP